MKFLIAIIKPQKFNAVREALERIDVTRLSVCDSFGYARQRGQTELYRGMEYETNLLRKLVIEIAVNDDFLESTIECLTQVARTGGEGAIGDGKIFVLPMDDSVRIGETVRGPGADLGCGLHDAGAESP